jgi:hypothetical protein
VIAVDEWHAGSRPDANYHDRFGYRQELFQVHGIDANEKVVVRKQLRRGKSMAFFEALSPCLIDAWQNPFRGLAIKA